MRNPEQDEERLKHIREAVDNNYTVQNHIVWQTINEDLIPLKEKLAESL